MNGFARRIALAVLLFASGSTLAQPPRPRGKAEQPDTQTTPSRALQPKAFAITEARVVAEPGRIIDGATVIVRDGFVEAVGTGIAAPPDALKIDGKGLTVYAGYVDACGHWGFDATLKRSEGGPTSPEALESEALAATKPDNRKGVTPEFAVNAALKDDETTDAWRKAGFTAALLAPEGGVFAGQSALVSLSGAPAREAILRAPVALHGGLIRITGDGYPRAQMGIVAHARQTLLDAGHYRRLHDDYEKRGRTGRRPPFDPALAALGEALDGKLPVVLEADGRDAIHRALDFAAEFKLKPIIYGGKDAGKLADRLATEKVPVLFRMTFTEPNEERDAQLTQRVRDERRRLREDEAATPAKLHKAGVPFAICSGGLAADKFLTHLRKVIAAGLSTDVALAAVTSRPAKLLGVEGQLGKIEAGRPAHLVVMSGDFDKASTNVRMVFADGIRFEFEMPAKDTKDAKEGREVAQRPKPDAESKAVPFVGPPSPEDMAAELEADRKPATRTGGNVLFRNATVLTVTNGTLKNANIFVRGGKIAAIGPNVSGEGATVIDATGMFVMPGIIDTHCHFAVAGGVNEFSLSMVPEVRVRDVVEGEDVQIYRALAGGVTTARLLHGSANCIGGQDAVIKLKFGKPGRELIVTEGPRGVKFALGENVKRTDGRFPNTRLGVEAVYIRAFTEAQEYRKVWDEYTAAKKDGKPVTEPRRDLRLESLADILRGDLRVHCHCYRADEILMLLRVADRFGFKVKSLQHVLEGYKVAPEIAAHGASVSLFSDWWAYKIEAADAIPYAGALLHEAGASVVLKSDSNELMRHMYQEAGKLVKYGGMSEDEALKSITLNGAKQLGLEKRIGSIEVGKDADLAIFNGHPLNSFSRVEMTLVEGEVYFQRSKELKADAAASVAPILPRTDRFKLPAANPDLPIAIRGATVHPVSGPAIANGTVVIERGRIRAVGQNGNVAIPPQAVVIPAEGLHLYPGMIDAATVLGLAELESAKETNDFREGGDFQPDLRASTGVNPDSELIPVTRANGVTTVVTRPTGSVIAGQGALINLAGWTPHEMTVADPLALHVELPSATPFFAAFDPTLPFGRSVAKKQRDEKLRRLRELFAQAIVYDDGRKQNPKQPRNPRIEALVPYARGEKPVVVQAFRKADIEEAIKLADDLKLKLVLSGGNDAWKLAYALKTRNIPVIVGPIMSMPQEQEDAFDAPFTNVAKLRDAGVRYCIRSAGASNTRNLPYEAAFAISYGLSPDEGLKSVTLYPAQILGVADELGSIEYGKRANLVLSTGDPLQVTTQVQAVFIDGRPLEPTSKQTRLYERYRERLKESKAAEAGGR